uniref:Uncharacterized protein n=1 Tax=Trepomonas sp. PC1 TaxID=1076344 RepID=A0A146K0M7_9EUKA|eukprot:JAP89139.1 Hypothetical protein TPC1_31366 [Trepomonas sp. PC1]
MDFTPIIMTEDRQKIIDKFNSNDKKFTDLHDYRLGVTLFETKDLAQRAIAQETLGSVKGDSSNNFHNCCYRQTNSLKCDQEKVVEQECMQEKLDAATQQIQSLPRPTSRRHSSVTKKVQKKRKEKGTIKSFTCTRRYSVATVQYKTIYNYPSKYINKFYFIRYEGENGEIMEEELGDKFHLSDKFKECDTYYRINVLGKHEEGYCVTRGEDFQIDPFVDKKYAVTLTFGKSRTKFQQVDEDLWEQILKMLQERADKVLQDENEDQTNLLRKAVENNPHNSHGNSKRHPGPNEPHKTQRK